MKDKYLIIIIFILALSLLSSHIVIYINNKEITELKQELSELRKELIEQKEYIEFIADLDSVNCGILFDYEMFPDTLIINGDTMLVRKDSVEVNITNQYPF